MPAKASPRFKKPGVRDPRLIIGLCIVLFSVLGVVGIIRTTNQTEPFYSVNTDVGIGQILSAENLTVVDARLAGSSDLYVSADQPIAPGTVAKRPIAAGELVAKTAITDDLKENRRLVTLLKDQYAVADFKPGDRVEIWVSPKEGQSAVLGEPKVIATSAEIHSVTAQESLIGGTGQSAVELWVAPDLLPAVLAANNNGSVINLVASTYSEEE